MARRCSRRARSAKFSGSAGVGWAGRLWGDRNGNFGGLGRDRRISRAWRCRSGSVSSRDTSGSHRNLQRWLRVGSLGTRRAADGDDALSTGTTLRRSTTKTQEPKPADRPRIPLAHRAYAYLRISGPGDYEAITGVEGAARSIVRPCRRHGRTDSSRHDGRDPTVPNQAPLRRFADVSRDDTEPDRHRQAREILRSRLMPPKSPFRPPADPGPHPSEGPTPASSRPLALARCPIAP